MTTCPNCGFLLELTRREQEGGAEFDTEKVIKSILSGEEKEFSFSAKNLYQTKEFKELKPEEQTEITQKIEQFKKDKNIKIIIEKPVIKIRLLKILGIEIILIKSRGKIK